MVTVGIHCRTVGVLSETVEVLTSTVGARQPALWLSETRSTVGILSEYCRKETAVGLSDHGSGLSGPLPPPRLPVHKYYFLPKREGAGPPLLAGTKETYSYR